MISYIRLLCGGILPLVLNIVGLMLSNFLGFKPFRVYDMSGEHVIVAMPSVLLAFIPIIIGVAFETLVPTALNMAF